MILCEIFYFVQCLSENVPTKARKRVDLPKLPQINEKLECMVSRVRAMFCESFIAQLLLKMKCFLPYLDLADLSSFTTPRKTKLVPWSRTTVNVSEIRPDR